MKLSRRDQLKIFGGGILSLVVGLLAVVGVIVVLALLVR